MKKLKRILAMLGVVLLVGLYLATAVSAVLVTPATKDLFLTSLVATVIIPILLYVLILIGRLLGRNKDNDQNQQEEEGEKP